MAPEGQAHGFNQLLVVLFFILFQSQTINASFLQNINISRTYPSLIIGMVNLTIKIFRFRLPGQGLDNDSLPFKYCLTTATFSCLLLKGISI